MPARSRIVLLTGAAGGIGRVDARFFVPAIASQPWTGADVIE
jgi:NAD(P)-dependent dehydrogenase (short-subunit alcohol dehydrogenase family)